MKDSSSFTPHGGSAFPTLPVTGDAEKYQGMTLRDYFAAKAMQSVLGSLTGVIVNEEAPGDFERYATSAYKIADAMLKVRGQ